MKKRWYEVMVPTSLILNSMNNKLLHRCKDYHKIATVKVKGEFKMDGLKIFKNPSKFVQRIFNIDHWKLIYIDFELIIQQELRSS